MTTIQDKIEQLKNLIPGYKGYSEHEDRRAADKELRDAVAAAFESQSDRLARAQERVLSHGDFDSLEVMDKARARLQHLAERIRHATYGYSGFFDRTKRYGLPELDRLYAFDLQLANGVDKVGEMIAQIGVADDVKKQANTLLRKLDELHETFDQRQHLIDTFPKKHDQAESADDTYTGEASATDDQTDA